MRLAIRGLPVVVTEQQAEHWCPIILTRELAAEADSADSPVPIVSTLLLETEPPGPDRPTGDDVGLSRYVVTLRVYKVVQTHGGSDFRNHLEQVSDWADSPIVDVGPAPGGTLGAWSGWNADILASNDAVPRMPNELALAPDAASSTLVGTVQLPAAARALPIFGPDASLQFTVSDRATATARQ